MVMQIRRTRITNNSPTNLLPGQLAVEMNDPLRMWVGVPTSIHASGRREIAPEVEFSEPSWQLFTTSGIYTPSNNRISWCWVFVKGGGGGGGHAWGNLGGVNGGGGGEGGTVWGFIEVDALAGKTITVGSGGSVNSASWDTVGGPGGESGIAGIITAQGGQGGGRGTEGGGGGQGGNYGSVGPEVTRGAILYRGIPGRPGGGIVGLWPGWLWNYGGGAGGIFGAAPRANSGAGGEGGTINTAPRVGAAGFVLFIEF